MSISRGKHHEKFLAHREILYFETDPPEGSGKIAFRSIGFRGSIGTVMFCHIHQPPSMGLAYLPPHVVDLYDRFVGKYTIHGYKNIISCYYSPSYLLWTHDSNAVFFSLKPGPPWMKMGAFVIILSHLSTCSNPWVLIQKNKKSWFQCSKTKGTKTFQDYNRNNIVSKQPTFLETVVILLHQLHPSQKKHNKSHNIVGTRLVGFPSWSPSFGVVSFLVHLLRSKPTTVTDPWHHEDLCWLVILWNGILISWAYEIILIELVIKTQDPFFMAIEIIEHGHPGSKIPYMTQPTGVWSLLMSFFWSTKREVTLLEVQESLHANHIPWRFKVNMKQQKLWTHDLYPNRIFPLKTHMSTRKSSNDYLFRQHVIFRGERIKFLPQKTSKNNLGIS